MVEEKNRSRADPFGSEADFEEGDVPGGYGTGSAFCASHPGLWNPFCEHCQLLSQKREGGGNHAPDDRFLHRYFHHHGDCQRGL